MPPYTPMTDQEANILAVLGGGKLVPEKFDYVGMAYPDSVTSASTAASATGMVRDRRKQLPGTAPRRCHD
jgi:hypothetical protein